MLYYDNLMEEPSLSVRILSFVQENLLLVVLVGAGIVLLGIGGLQMLGSKSSDFEFQKGAQVEATSSAAIGTLVVDVSGEVTTPGVYKLSTDSRIQDAVTAAGGFSPKADQAYISKYINLAQKLADGVKIYIPPQNAAASQTSGAAPSTQTASSQSGIINVNTASATELDSLSGVGPVTATKIINARPYSTTDELLSKKVVSQKVFNAIKDQISVF